MVQVRKSASKQQQDGKGEPIAASDKEVRHFHFLTPSPP